MISVSGRELGIFRALEPIAKTPADASRASASANETLNLRTFRTLRLSKGAYEITLQLAHCIVLKAFVFHSEDPA
jgi:hypothetical protein